MPSAALVTASIDSPEFDRQEAVMLIAKKQTVSARGSFVATFADLNVSRFNTVLASATEIGNDDQPFLGLAVVAVDNVVIREHDRQVLVRGHVEWPDTIRVEVTLYSPLKGPYGRAHDRYQSGGR
jgi:hypothetical protein